MKILVTGAAGYIGSVLVPTLLSVGHEVVALDLFPGGVTPLALCLADKWLKIVRQDVLSHEDMMMWYGEVDAIIPLSAIVGAPACNRHPVLATEINHISISRLMHWCPAVPRMVVYPTTNSGYGIGTDAECTEESPLNPISHYGKTKMAAEEAVLSVGGISLRLATVFGQSPSFRRELLVNDFTYRAVKDRALVVFEGHHRRNYIHVRDVCKAFLHAIDNYDEMAGQAYNVGLSSANLTKLELCAKIKEHVPHFWYTEADVGKDPDQRDYLVSNAKIEATGWKPDYTLDDGIAELVRSYI